MLASQHFKITPTDKDDWFDAILNLDTPLFLDPFFVFKESRGIWADAHDEIITHFERAFMLIAEGNMKPESLPYKKAVSLLEFKEPKELCLGYTAQGTAGSGSGRVFALSIANAISNSIKRGLEHPRHFEELGVLNEGIGRDRISDISCTILKSRLIYYTQEIARRHNIKLDKHEIYAASFDERRLRWQTQEVDLPTNPFGNRGFIFAPKRFLDDLPTLNADDWWEWYEEEKLREDVNYEIMGNVDKRTIIDIARRNPEYVRKWSEASEERKPNPYNFNKDPQGVWVWVKATDAFTEANPIQIAPPQTREEFFNVIDLVIGQFKLFIEEQGGWMLLWKDYPYLDDKPEHAAQLVFRGIAQNYCKANNISLDAEVNLGRGPVDFKFSNGYTKRAHLEVKKLHNGKFWNGLSEQLPSYLKSDELADGWFLAIRYRDNKASEDKIKQLPVQVKAISDEKRLNLRWSLVDARPKESASNL